MRGHYSGLSDRELDRSDYEPNLAAPEHHPSCYMADGRSRIGDQTAWAAGGADDREDEHDGAESDEDGEPSLGWTDVEAATGDQARQHSYPCDYEADDYEGRVAYLDRRRATSPAHNRPGFMRGPHDAA